LHSVYYAQRDHFVTSKAYAKTIEELGLELPAGLSDPIIRVDDKAFMVEVTTAPKAGDPHHWSIASDAKLTRIR
jgi:hypothetical protein